MEKNAEKKMGENAIGKESLPVPLCPSFSSCLPVCLSVCLPVTVAFSLWRRSRDTGRDQTEWLVSAFISLQYYVLSVMLSMWVKDWSFSNLGYFLSKHSWLYEYINVIIWKLKKIWIIKKYETRMQIWKSKKKRKKTVNQKLKLEKFKVKLSIYLWR